MTLFDQKALDRRVSGVLAASDIPTDHRIAAVGGVKYVDGQLVGELVVAVRLGEGWKIVGSVEHDAYDTTAAIGFAGSWK